MMVFLIQGLWKWTAAHALWLLICTVLFSKERVTRIGTELCCGTEIPINCINQNPFVNSLEGVKKAFLVC